MGADDAMRGAYEWIGLLSGAPLIKRRVKQQYLAINGTMSILRVLNVKTGFFRKNSNAGENWAQFRSGLI